MIEKKKKKPYRNHRLNWRCDCMATVSFAFVQFVNNNKSILNMFIQTRMMSLLCFRFVSFRFVRPLYFLRFISLISFFFSFVRSFWKIIRNIFGADVFVSSFAIVSDDVHLFCSHAMHTRKMSITKLKTLRQCTTTGAHRVIHQSWYTEITMHPKRRSQHSTAQDKKRQNEMDERKTQRIRKMNRMNNNRENVLIYCMVLLLACA